MATWAILEHEWYDYAGPAAECKGEQEQLKKTELANQATELKNQADALAMQKSLIGPLRDAGLPYLSTEGIGFSDKQMALLNSQFLNKQSQGFNQSFQQVTDQLRQRGAEGGLIPAGGDAARYLSSLFGLNAATTSAGLTDIQLQNAQQALTNKFNTMGIFAGVGGNYGNQSVGLGNNAANFGQIAFNAGQSRPGFGESFLTSLGSSLGHTIGSGGISSGPGGTTSSFGTCWIAEAIYGPGAETEAVRHWLNHVWAEESVIGALVMKLYALIGRWVARQPMLCRWLKPLFDRALARARA